MRNSKSKKVYCFFIAKTQEERTRKMKNIEEKILMTEEEIKQLQNKRKVLCFTH